MFKIIAMKNEIPVGTVEIDPPEVPKEWEMIVAPQMHITDDLLVSIWVFDTEARQPEAKDVPGDNHNAPKLLVPTPFNPNSR